jgi:hypothetical protein
VSERFAVETLSHWSGVFKFLPFDNTMAKFVDLKDFAYVGAWRECNYKYWIFGYDCVSSFVCVG